MVVPRRLHCQVALMTRAASSFWRRHTEGWPLLVVAVGIALMSAVLVVPRPTPPARVLPSPRIDRQEQRRVLALSEERAARAHAEPLPYEVRAVGELLRRFGRAAAAGDQVASAALGGDLRRAAETARERQGDEALLLLRAVQGQLFLRALERWEASGAASPDDPELAELGGTFLATARASGWISGGRLILGRAERHTLFEIRWTDLVGLAKQGPLSPSLNQWRTYYGFLLRHPAGARDARDADQRRLDVAQALGRVDPEFYTSLARGMLQVRLGDHAAAARSLQGHLAAHPNGPWQLIARNQLATALVHLGAVPR